MSHADKLAKQVRLLYGIRRMHFRTNVSACVQAPISQFGSSAHGSLQTKKITPF